MIDPEEEANLMELRMEAATREGNGDANLTGKEALEEKRREDEEEALELQVMAKLHRYAIPITMTPQAKALEI